jgi:glycosyltransferase involved in cell wall biosynthesis
MARIVFVSMHYPPEIGAAQTHISETAEGLARRGHDVIVVTTLPNYPRGLVFPEYRHRLKRAETINGVRVVRAWTFISPKKTLVHRLLSQVSFGRLIPGVGKRAVGRADLVIAVSPLLAAVAGRRLAQRLGCPYVFNVADLWPEVAIQLGALRNPIAIRRALRMETRMYRDAAAIWTVTEGIRQDLLRRGVAAEKVFTIPIGADTRLLRPQSRESARDALGWDARFTVVHAGNIALAHGLSVVLDAAEQLRDRPDIRLIIIGDSATGSKTQMVAEAERRGLTNITFLGQQPHGRIPLFIAAADACLVSVKRIPILEGALPVKMFEAMACGRPVVLAVAGEARHLAVDEAAAAVAVEPEDASAIAAAITHLQAHPEECVALGERGRAYMETHLDRELLTDALDRRLAGLVGMTRPAQVVAALVGARDS